MTKSKMTEKEKQDWDNLCQYVKKEILQYTDDMAIPKHLIMRLRGMANGQYIANNTHRKKAKYSYDVILLTFKFCKFDILKAISKKHFESEQNKINYIMAIVDNNINEVVLRLNAKKKNDEKISKQQIVDYELKVKKSVNKDTKNIGKSVSKGTKNTRKSVNKNFEDLTNDLW